MKFALQALDERHLGILRLAGGPKSGHCTFRSLPKEYRDLDLPESEHLYELEKQGEFRWKDVGDECFRIEDTSGGLIAQIEREELTTAKFTLQAIRLPADFPIEFFERPAHPVKMKIVVSSVDGDRVVKFKGAVGHGGGLDLVESTTPYVLYFSAIRVIALFESVESNVPIRVELYGDFDHADIDGRPVSSFTGLRGGIGKDVLDHRPIGVGGIFC